MFQLSPTVRPLKYAVTNVINNVIFSSLISCKTGFHWMILSFLFFTSNISLSQDLNKKITIKLKNRQLIEVIGEISEKGHIFFSYNPQIIPSDNKKATITYGYNNHNEPVVGDECPTKYRLDWEKGTHSGTIYLFL